MTGGSRSGVAWASAGRRWAACELTSRHGGRGTSNSSLPWQGPRPARIAIVSNAWPHAGARLAADGVAELVDDVVLSCETGVAKPDVRRRRLEAPHLGLPAVAAATAGPAVSLPLGDLPVSSWSRAG